MKNRNKLEEECFPYICQLSRQKLWNQLVKSPLSMIKSMNSVLRN